MRRCTASLSSLLVCTCLGWAQMVSAQSSPTRAWMDTSLSADQRADLVLKELTLEEKLNLLHGTSGAPLGALGAGTSAVQSNGGAGMFGGVPRLNIAAVQMADASYGVTHGRQTGRYATAMPSTLAAASSWDPQLAYEYGALIGKDLRAQGYNMSLGGGVNLAREPRDGRTFEYQGEDPLLAGTMDGQLIRGVQAQHILGDIKHFALNDQESGRNAANIIISERAMRETDLLAFEIGVRTGDPGAVMCSYNRVAGEYACENHHLLTDILKHDWKFKGFVLSDWGGTHSTAKALHAGLDNEEPNSRFFGDALAKAIAANEISQTEIDEHVHRILRAEFAAGIIDHPMQREVVDVEAGLAIAQKAAEESIVLLKNRENLLPLNPAAVHSVAIIGAHADAGMLSGGGSAQVDPPGGNAVPPADKQAPGRGFSVAQVWFPGSPLQALKARFPSIAVTFTSGDDPAAAAALAKSSDVAIVFAAQWEAESIDLDSLALSAPQDNLIIQVSAANPRTVVILESGGPVLMPWVEKAAGIVEAWYAGSRGAAALTRILAGDVNPSAKLPITFPVSDLDLPHPTLIKPPVESRPLPPSPGPPDPAAAAARATRILAPFPIDYDEGLKVGYKWYDAEHKSVLFPFGFGLSYTRFTYSDLKLESTPEVVTIHFTVTNQGPRDGVEIAEVYASLPEAAGEPPKRLAGWSRITLAAGASKSIAVAIDPGRLTIYDTASNSWKLVPGAYTLRVGGSSQDLPLSAMISLGR
jgi:beta-glucosidase